MKPGDRVVVRRRAGSHLTDVIGHVVSLDPLVVRPQKVGGLPSEAEAIRIDDPLVVRRMSPRRVRNSDIRAVETAYARAWVDLEERAGEKASDHAPVIADYDLSALLIDEVR